MAQNRPSIARMTILALTILLLPQLLSAQSAGLIEYFVPGPEQQLRAIFENMDNDPPVGDHMDAIITVAAAADSTTLYYDHWENGYNFDPDNPSSADEVWLLNAGEHRTFSDEGIFANPRNSADTYYDGGDRIYTVGGPVTLTRTSWPTDTPTYYALSWEVYPNKLLNQDYIIPIGENLDNGALGYTDFENTYVLLQATRDNTHVTVNDPYIGGVELDTTLALGDYTQLYHINAGTEVHADMPIQVQFVVGRTWGGANSECRGFSAVPTAAWGQSYYCPVTSWDNGFHSDLYLYNPNDYAINIEWENTGNEGILTLDASETRSFYEVTGYFLPEESGTFVSSDDVFWGIGAGGTRNGAYDWGFGLVPEEYLTTNYHLGWAPSTWDMTEDGSPVFVTATKNNTTVWVDWSPPDGEPDASWELDRLEMLKINDPDHDNSGLRIWGTDALAVTWGEDADMASPGDNFLDVGYAALPIPDAWMELVLRVESEAAPASLPGDGGSSQLQVEVNSFAYAVDDPTVIANLPTGWDYIPGSSIMTLPDGTVITGGAADPQLSGAELIWQQLTSFAPQEDLHIDFTVQTNGEHAEGQNEFAIKAQGRWDESQVFYAQTSSWVFIASADSRIKPLYLREDNGYTLQRVPPSGDHADLWIPEGGSANWMLSPILTDSLHISGDINILLYLYRSSPLYSPDAAIELKWNDGVSHSIGIDEIADIGSGFYTFVLPAVDLTLPAGAFLELVVTATEEGPGDRSLHIRYDGEQYQSRVVLATDTYLAVSSFAAYDGPWPGGEMASVFYADTPIWFTTVATDPFGYADITSSSLGVPPVIDSLPLSVVEEGDNRRVFSAATSIALPGTYTATDTTREGFEGTVEIVRDFMLTIIKTDLHSTLSYNDLNGGALQPGDSLRVNGLLFNNGTADATGTNNELTLPAQLTYIDGSSSQGTIELNGNILSLEPGTIVSDGDSVSWNFLARLDEIIDNNTLLQLQSLLTDNEGDVILSDDPVFNQWSDEETGNDPSDPTDDDPLGLLISSAIVIELTCTATDLNGTPTEPGDSLAYQLQLTNSGNQALNDPAEILFALAVPENTTYHAGSAGSSSGIHWMESDTLYWQGTVAVGDTIYLNCTVDLALPLFNGTEISAQAIVLYDAESSGDLSTTALSDDPATPELLDPTLVTVSSAPALEAALSVLDLNGQSTVPGDTLSWQLVIQNDGNSNSADNDGPEALLPCPGWNSPISWESSQGTLQLVDDTLQYSGDYSVGEDVTITLLTVLDQTIPDQTLVQTQAVVLFDSTSNGNNDWQQMSDDPSTPESGDPTGILISSSLQLTALLTVSEAQTVISRASSERKSMLTLEQQQREELAVFYPGSSLQYDFLISNNGGNPPTNMDWTLDLPQELVNLSNLLFPPEAENLTDTTGGSWGNGLLHFRFDNLAFGDTLQFSFQVAVDSITAHNTLVSCQAGLNCDQLAEPMLSDSDPDSDGAQTTDILVERALLQGEAQLSALDSDGYPLTPGDTLELTMNWINHSDITLSDISFTDAILPELPWFQLLELPEGAIDNSTDSGGEWGYGQIQIDNLQAEPGDTLTCSWQTVTATVPDSTIVAIQGELFSASDTLLTDALPDSAGYQPLILMIQNRPDLMAELTVTVDSQRETGDNGGFRNWFSLKNSPEIMEISAAPGDRLLWEFNLLCNGTDLAEELTMSVSLPAWLEETVIEEWSDALEVTYQSDGGDYDNGLLTATGDGLENGDSLIFTFSTVIQTDIPDSTLLSTSGSVITDALPETVFTDGDSETPGDQPTEVLVLSPEGELSGTLQLTDLNGGHIRSGDTLRFVSHWDNSHLYALSDLVYSHEMPPFTHVIQSLYLPDGAVDSLAWTGGAYDRGLIQVSDLELPGAGVDSLEYLLLVDSLLTESVTDTTQATLQHGEDFLLTDGNLFKPGIQPTMFTLMADDAPDIMQLQLTRIDDDPLWIGGEADYELCLTNLDADSLYGCTINLPLPDWVADATVTGQPADSLLETEDVIAVYDFAIAGGDSATLAFTLQLDDELSPDDIIELQGWSSSLLIPGPIYSNLWSDTVSVAPPSLTFTLTASVGGIIVEPGATILAQDSLVYNFLLTNSGGTVLEDIIVTDTLDATLQYSGATTDAGTIAFSERVFTITGITLQTGETLDGSLSADIMDPVPRYTVISEQWTAQCDTMTVRSDADPLLPDAQPLEQIVDFIMSSPLLIWDNPARERDVCIAYHAPGAGSVSLTIYNVLGEQVRKFDNLPPGSGMTLMWHTDNNSGQALANGTYILVLKIDGEMTREKIALIR
jgi:uncharacterized repeat protein (TIGR01451 family)